MQAAELLRSYDDRLVILSILIAMMASFAALDLAGRVHVSRRGPQAAWLAGGAFAMGSGIWSMHYIGMLAFRLPVPIFYDTATVVLSLIAAIFAAAVALMVVSGPRMDARRLAFGGFVMGLGIVAMHYIGMAAMRVQADMAYDRARVAVSVVIAIAVSLVALALAFHLRADRGRAWLLQKLGSAAVMGIAIAGMHYTGMSAAHFTPTPTPLDVRNAVGIGVLGVGAIAGSTVMVLALAIVTSVLDRRFTTQSAALELSEEALRVQERFLRDVIDANPHLVFAKDWDGRFTLANRAVAAVYGTTPEELVGKTDADFNSNQEEVAAFRRADQAVIQSGRPLSVPEEPVTGPTGETRWFQTIKVPLSTGDQTRQILGVATDITDRKQLEEQLRQAQKMEAIGRLAGGVAHDFNNLITVVMGHAELLLLDVPPDHPHRWELEEIRAAARRAAGLTQQLLAFSRRQVLQPRVVDLNELVTGMSTMLRRLMGEDIELRTVAGTRLGPVHADPGQLEQVLMNLVVNARDAMPLGGIVTIETANVDVDDPRARPTQGHYRLPAGSYVLLAVADSGEGVDAEVMAHLFEPFFTTKGPGKGTGLGLATVYGIVKQSEGHILVDSEPGQGATFRIYLPRVSASAPADAPAAAAPVGGTETVLVVEDEPSVLRLSCSMLNLLGYHVLAASNGEEALTMAAAFPGAIHILITDVVMPKTGGRELAERLRVVRPGTKVLYVSGYTDDAILRHGVLDQGVAFLQKPFTAAELAQMVRQVLDAG